MSNSGFRDNRSQLGHCALDIIGRSLDVAVRRGADVRVTEDSLNDHVRHTEAIEIAAQPAAARVLFMRLQRMQPPAGAFWRYLASIGLV